jgi:sugar lactone lactonase YvrE
MAQLWGELDGTYYTANWGSQTCAKFSAWPSSNQRQWVSPNLGSTVGGVASDEDHVYCATTTGGRVYLLDKGTGESLGQRTLSGGSTPSLSGGLAVAQGKLYWGAGRTVYRYDLANFSHDGFFFTTAMPISNLFFTGQDLCVSSGSSMIYCYRVLNESLYEVDAGEPVLVDTLVRSYTHSVNTRSYGAGYHPILGESWFPAWGGTTIYRYSPQDVYLGEFSSSQFSTTVRQLWVDQADGFWYTADYTAGTVSKYNPLFVGTRVWRVTVEGLGGICAGVSVAGDAVYVMGETGSTVVVLDKVSGETRRSFALTGGAPLVSLSGGLAVVNGTLWYADSTEKSIQRFSVDTGSFDGAQVFTNNAFLNMYFDGEALCGSPANSNVECYGIFSGNVYGENLDRAPSLLSGSAILTPVQNEQLSTALRPPSGQYVWRQCYNGERDGFAARTFHDRCDNKGPTITVLRVDTGGPKGRVFGGYSKVSWASRSQYVYSNADWLFRFAPDLERTLPTLNRPQNAIYDAANYCPTFGGGHDLYLDSGCRTGSSSASSYSAAGGYGSDWLAGASRWTIDAIEVYYLSHEFDACDNVTCTPLDACHVAGVCRDGLCSNPLAADGVACDDGDPTTFVDECTAGTCAGTTLFTSGLSFNVSGLSEATDYALSVQAFTTAGGGPLSPAVAVMTEEGVPGAPPLDVTARATSATALELTWAAPPRAEWHGALTRYTVYYARLASGASDPPANLTGYTVAGHGLFTRYTLRGLAVYSRYAVRVTVATAVGQGPASPAVVASTGEGVPLAAPAGVNVTVLNGTALAVRWFPAAPETLRGVLRGYTVIFP